MDYMITDDLTVLVRYQFITDHGPEWSVWLRPAAIEANCDEHKAAAWELARYEQIAARLIRQGNSVDKARAMLDDITAEVIGDILEDLHGASY